MNLELDKKWNLSCRLCSFGSRWWATCFCNGLKLLSYIPCPLSKTRIHYVIACLCGKVELYSCVIGWVWNYYRSIHTLLKPWVHQWCITVVKVGGGVGQRPATEKIHVRLNQPSVVHSSPVLIARPANQHDMVSETSFFFVCADLWKINFNKPSVHFYICCELTKCSYHYMAHWKSSFLMLKINGSVLFCTASCVTVIDLLVSCCFKWKKEGFR